MNTIFNIKKNNNFNYTVLFNNEIVNIRFNRLNNIQLVKNNSIRDINLSLHNCIYSYENIEINNIRNLLTKKKKGFNNYFLRVKNRDIFNENKVNDKLYVEVYNLIHGQVFKGNNKIVDVLHKYKVTDRSDRLKLNLKGKNEIMCSLSNNIIADYKLLNDQFLSVMDKMNYSLLWICENNNLTHLKIIKYDDNEIFFTGKYVIGKALVLDNVYDCLEDIDVLVDYTPSTIIDDEDEKNTKNTKNIDLLCDYFMTLEQINIKEKNQIIEQIEEIINGDKNEELVKIEKDGKSKSSEGLLSYLTSFIY